MPQNPILEALKTILTGHMTDEEYNQYPPYKGKDLNYPDEPAPPNIGVNMHTANVHPGHWRPGSNYSLGGDRKYDINLPPTNDLNYPMEPDINNIDPAGMMPLGDIGPYGRPAMDERYGIGKPKPRSTDIPLPVQALRQLR